MKLQVSYATQGGTRHTVNQDALGLSQDSPPAALAERGQLFIVADGYGKDQAGTRPVIPPCKP